MCVGVNIHCTCIRAAINHSSGCGYMRGAGESERERGGGESEGERE